MADSIEPAGVNETAVVVTLIERLRALHLIPVVEIDEPRHAVPLAEALIAGGLPCIEITFRTPAALRAISTISREIPNMTIGAGTILSAAQAVAARDAGATFLAAPALNGQVADVAQALNVPFIPGVSTPTEIEAALRRGLTVLKFFPAEAGGGTAFLRSVTAVYRNVLFVPTGGVSASNLAAYLSTPMVLACGGSWLVARELIAAGDFATITQLVSEAVAIAEAASPRPIASDRG